MVSRGAAIDERDSGLHGPRGLANPSALGHDHRLVHAHGTTAVVTADGRGDFRGRRGSFGKRPHCAWMLDDEARAGIPARRPERSRRPRRARGGPAGMWARAAFDSGARQTPGGPAPRLTIPLIDGTRHDAQLATLDELAQRMVETNAFQRARLAGARVRTLDDLRALPFTTKHELLADQAATPPYGTNLTYPLERYTHLHLTSGTIGEQLRVLQTAEDWLVTQRCFARVLSAAGITAADRVAMPFPFGAYLQFWAAAAGVEDVGALALPLGGLEGRERLRAIAEFEATAIVCTPTYALAPHRRRPGTGPRGGVRVGPDRHLPGRAGSVHPRGTGADRERVGRARVRSRGLDRGRRLLLSVRGRRRAPRQRRGLPVRDPRPAQRRGGRRRARRASSC